MGRGRRLALVMVTALLVVGAGCQTTPPSESPGGVPVATATPSPGDPLTVLRAWDERRSRAYAQGDARALKALYAEGSTAGRRDTRLLRRYAARGLRVVGIRTQVLAAEVRRETDRRLVLVVTERVTGAAAVGRGRRIRLPQGAARRRVVSLVQRRGRWVVTEVGGRVGE